MADPVIFFDKSLRVFGAPGRYLQGPGALEKLGPIAAGMGSRVVLVTDPGVNALYGERIARVLAAEGVAMSPLVFEGELTVRTAPALAARFAPAAGDVILACGGGKAIDCGKALAELTGGPLICAPTAASTDAPTSKNFVLYDEAHRLAEVRHLPRNPDMVVVDTRILAAAPRELFAAGLGDALAKRVEAEACAAAGGVNMFRAAPTRTALVIARACEETLLAHGAAAYDAAGTGTPNEAFEAVVEATILMAGLGFESGGLSIAHALTRGVPQVPEAARAPHGFQVAWGVLVQKAAEGAAPEPAMIRLMRHAGLPLSFADLCGRTATEDDFAAVAAGTAGVPHLDNTRAATETEALVIAMRKVEAAALENSGGPS